MCESDDNLLRGVSCCLISSRPIVPLLSSCPCRVPFLSAVFPRRAGAARCPTSAGPGGAGVFFVVPSDIRSGVTVCSESAQSPTRVVRSAVKIPLTVALSPEMEQRSTVLSIDPHCMPMAPEVPEGATVSPLGVRPTETVVKSRQAGVPHLVSVARKLAAQVSHTRGHASKVVGVVEPSWRLPSLHAPAHGREADF